MSYRLGATLKGHTQDVRDLVSIADTKIASVSRDGTVRVWTLDEEEQNVWKDKLIHSSEKFLNSITFDPEHQLLYFGGNDFMINAKPYSAEIDEDPVLTLIGHESNICSLNFDTKQDSLVSGSWDKTARVWQNGQTIWELKGHSASVWDAQCLSEDGETYITASADRTIKIWKQGELVQTFTGIHNDVIRKVVMLDSGKKFASASNDCTVKICSTDDGQVLSTLWGHESFVYDLKLTSSNELISCGEDRSVRIWSLDGILKQVIRLPAISIWCIDSLPNGDLIVGSSDNTIRIFSKDIARVAPESEQKAFNALVANSSINAKVMDFDESKISPYEILQQPGNKEGQLVVVKSPVGFIEAHQYSQGSWVKVGDVVGSSTGVNDKKTEFEGKMYDYLFDVDIQEGHSPLKLPVNANDNPYTLADQFITRYELPPSYKEQLVNFIITSTSDGSLDQSIPAVQINCKILPVKFFLSISSFNPDTIFNGIAKLNEKEKSFDDEALAEIGAALHDIDQSWPVLYSVAETIRQKWTVKLPAYDIIRIIAINLTDSTDISKYVKEGLGNKNITIAMLTARLLVNVFKNDAWGISLMGSNAVKQSIFDTIDTIFPDATKQQSMNFAISISTLIFNYTVLILQDKSHLDVVHIIADAINSKFGNLEEYQGSEEASYRLAIAFGNLSTLEPSLRQYAASVTWLQAVKRKYGTIPRFQELFSDLGF